MQNYNNLIKITEFRIKALNQQLHQVQSLIADFNNSTAQLELQIKEEEIISGISDVGHFAYPIAAKSCRNRKQNLINSTAKLYIQQRDIIAKLKTSQEELQELETLYKEEIANKKRRHRG